MEKVMVVSTGGTIVSVDNGGGAVPDAGAAGAAVARALDYLRGRGFECVTAWAFGEAGIDSSDMSPDEWLALSRVIVEGRDAGIKKFLVVHGTDTMAYSAAWLSLTVSGAAVVLTGSQRVPAEDGFDGADNLLGAAKLLCDTERGVFIYFACESFPGAYVHKEDSSALCAYVRTGGGVSPFFGLPRNAADALETARRLAVVYLHPAYSGGFPKNVKIIILCGYGAGNMAQRLHGEIEAAYGGAERPVIIAASSCAKGEKNPARYGGVGMAALAGKKFTVFGQGSYSLEFLITLSYLALLSDADAPEKILARCLEKF
ncbi:asparaginase domain-containing protein [Cloacibacillus sp. An23]|uniref:asparaginase domain-containing protein n=1 Tax=Cloacibacillus sp. An23 TaxID=1965591 RepID=UPI000B391F85|nr:asparaginase domain-containing protein [Cloacibacillus sp. An23]OUO93003.1 hypothetical protein B5F39_09130 [Cloacibacillus sp. An23]